MVTATFKIDPDEKLAVDKICKANGTNLSEFLRMCCRGLISDYNG